MGGRWRVVALIGIARYHRNKCARVLRPGLVHIHQQRQHGRPVFAVLGGIYETPGLGVEATGCPARRFNQHHHLIVIERRTIERPG